MSKGDKMQPRSIETEKGIEFEFMGGAYTAIYIKEFKNHRFSFTEFSCKVPRGATNERIEYDYETKHATHCYTMENPNYGKIAVHFNGRTRIFSDQGTLDAYLRRKDRQIAESQAIARRMRHTRGHKIRKMIADKMRHARELGIKVEVIR